MKLGNLVIKAILAHAAEDYPREACGLIVHNENRQRYVRCRNLAQEPQAHFMMSPEDYAQAEDSGTLVAVVHSHPDATTTPSHVDQAQCDRSQLPWVIVSWPEGDVRTLMPQQGIKPLLARPFVHGIWDCYAIVRDWYQLERAIPLPNFARTDDWVEPGENLYMTHYAEAGFTPVTDALQPGDVIIMQVRANEPNHAGVYVGNGEMLHHMYGQLSQKVPYGGYWLDRTIIRLRYTGGHHDASR